MRNPTLLSQHLSCVFCVFITFPSFSKETWAVNVCLETLAAWEEHPLKHGVNELEKVAGRTWRCSYLCCKGFPWAQNRALSDGLTWLWFWHFQIFQKLCWIYCCFFWLVSIFSRMFGQSQCPFKSHSKCSFGHMIGAPLIWPANKLLLEWALRLIHGFAWQKWRRGIWPKWISRKYSYWIHVKFRRQKSILNRCWMHPHPRTLVFNVASHTPLHILSILNWSMDAQSHLDSRRVERTLNCAKFVWPPRGRNPAKMTWVWLAQKSSIHRSSLQLVHLLYSIYWYSPIFADKNRWEANLVPFGTSKSWSPTRINTHWVRSRERANAGRGGMDWGDFKFRNRLGS